VGVKMKINLCDLVEAGGHWLELFDESFTQDNVPLHARPLKSALWFVKDGIEKLPYGESKEDFVDKEWFAALVIVIREWYQDRYGAMNFKAVNDVLCGLVLLYGVPSKVEVRTTVATVEIEGETSWCTFPDSIHESENLSSFFPAHPNLNKLSMDKRYELEEQVASIVRSVRSINLALQAAADLSEEATQMALGIWGHIEKAVADILTLKPAVAGVGCWELHLAVEKAFKVYLMQNGISMHGHNLNKLSIESAKFGLEVTQSVLDMLPDEHRAIKLRYGEADMEISEAVKNYNAVLQLVYEITGKLKKTYSVNNASFLLKKPRWV